MFIKKVNDIIRSRRLMVNSYMIYIQDMKSSENLYEVLACQWER